MEIIRNETEIEIAGKKILLRAEFSNLQKFERAVGGIGIFMAPIAKTGMINLTDAALLIHHMQASENTVKYSLDECFKMVLEKGVTVTKDLMQFVSMLTAGNKRVDQMGDEQKKE